jgi:tRNA nucleotidyltransferase (CCA-adding enzyme)
MSEMKRLATKGLLDHLTPERIWHEVDKALGLERPSAFFICLREAGILGRLLPEIDRLFGVPQRADVHPEVDTGIHTMMVVDIAATLTYDRAVRFAALVHDLGKGLTPMDLLPRHHGHEDKGAELIAPMVRRLAGPAFYADLGGLCARLHGKIHKVAELRPGTVLEVLTACDGFHHPERLNALLVAAEADKRGRLGHEASDYLQAIMWRQALSAAAAITAKSLMAQGYQPGPKLGEILFQKRVEAIKVALSK